MSASQETAPQVKVSTIHLAASSTGKATKAEDLIQKAISQLSGKDLSKVRAVQVILVL